MRILLVLGLLGVWLGDIQAQTVIKTGLAQHEIFEAIPTQIESPSEVDDEEGGADGNDDEEGDDEEGDDSGEDNTDEVPDIYDINYVVDRPTSEPEGRIKCEDIGDIGAEGELDCEDEASPRAPYKKYRKYKTWKRRPLLVVIIGGLRWDYLTKSDWNMTEKTVGNMKAFNWIKKHGTTMSQVVPVFPPYDLPTWTSLATGLYPKNTGVVGDYMYNLDSFELFNREDNKSSLDNWWVKGEPIWSLAARNKRKVSVLNWHDCKLPGKNITKIQDDCKPFTTSTKPLRKQQLIRLFNKAITKIHSGGYDMSIVYTDNLKLAAKRYGPNSAEVMRELANLDEVLQGRLSDIKTKKERADLKLNVLLLSDYGLNGINRTTKVVLDDYLEFNHTQFIIQRGGSCVLVPFALRAGDIMKGFGGKKGVANMIGVSAYVRNVNLETPALDYPEIPDDLNYAGHTWTQDILLVAKPGFEIEIRTDSRKILPPLNDDQGMSGYIPQPQPPYIVPGRDKHKSKETRAREKMEVFLYDQFAHMMKTVGFAWGPDFKPGFVSKPVEIVDLYQIMAFLLNIPPNAHDGSWDRIKDMLVISAAPTTYMPLLLSTVSTMVLLLLA
jgi:predicted AlkP superfamily pyrophosphatase or phosphodiesterase